MLKRFDNFFLFEFYLRAIYSNQKSEYEKLKELSKNIHEKIAENEFQELLHEEQSGLDSEDILDMILDALQFDIKPSYFYSCDLSESVERRVFVKLST